MTVWPLKFRQRGDGEFLLTDDAGGFFLSAQSFLERYIGNTLSSADQTFLRENGHSFEREGDPDWTAFAYRWARRQSKQQELSYVILVPTLRCNLTCGYCQVSRAPETARGFDWSDETLNASLSFIGAMKGPRIKGEFQGGEPLLRVDLLERIRSFTRARFPGSQFVVCTNLQRLGDREWAFLEQADTFVSTSLDGDRDTHQRQRTPMTIRQPIRSSKTSPTPCVVLDRVRYPRFRRSTLMRRPISRSSSAISSAMVCNRSISGR